jgi:xanthine dehydrogenase iron-sulfur cluster and FAD-binding subunit A
MADKELRAARTEALFRDVNERIAESAQRFYADEAEFVCECADPECAERVPATLDEYEDVRADGTHFLLVPGHEDTGIEHVVARPHRRFAVVRKVNEVVARTVRRLNPRAEPA